MSHNLRKNFNLQQKKNTRECDEISNQLSYDSKSDSKSDQLEEETTGLEKLSGDFRLFCFYFNKSIETNLPIQKNIQENILTRSNQDKTLLMVNLELFLIL